jgi:hypothetical protein
MPNITRPTARKLVNAQVQRYASRLDLREHPYNLQASHDIDMPELSVLISAFTPCVPTPWQTHSHLP